MSAKLEFWFEYGSPYSYLAAMRAQELADEAGVALAWKPFLLGVIFKEDLGYLDSPFNRFPKKADYMWRDMQRLCEMRDLPAFKIPKPFPQNGLLASRITCALQGDERLPVFVRSVYRAEFQYGEDISKPEVMFEILSQNGFDAPSLMEAAQLKKNKQKLMELTATAQSKGMFGAPSFVTPDGELFWGDDRLPVALEWMTSHK